MVGVSLEPSQRESVMFRTRVLVHAYLFIVLMLLLLSSGCYSLPPGVEGPYGNSGGGQDLITVQMPFHEGYMSRCTQGAFGAYSHQGRATKYDVDLDTPNNTKDLVYAPVSGKAFVHTDRPNDDFGIHVNIGLGDGTYIVLGHLSEVFIENGAEVAAGSMLGYEGSTGASSGDHVHMGRHKGDPGQDAIYGESVEGLAIQTRDVAINKKGDFKTTELTCGLSDGHLYESDLLVPMWHPGGTLVKTPGERTVYLLEAGSARPFMTQSAFWDSNRDFEDVVLVSEYELACYDRGEPIDGNHAIRGVIDDDGDVWLLEDSDDRETAFPVTTSQWQSVLKSWGMNVSTFDDLTAESELGFQIATYDISTDPAVFRNGTLVRESSHNDVFMISEGIAMPVFNWNTLVLLGFAGQNPMWVEDGTIENVQGAVGSCGVDAYCLTPEDVTTCGGPADGRASSQSGGMGRQDSDDDSSDDLGMAGSSGDANDPNDPGGTAGPSTHTLSLIWNMPGGRTADRITLSGEVTHADGSIEPWSQWGEVYGNDHLQYFRYANWGDTLRYSVEFQEGNSISWSCLGPFPPGVEQGTSWASMAMADFSPMVTGAPNSGGCELTMVLD